MSIDLTQFYQVFFEETAEHLAEMEALLLALDVSRPDADGLNAIFRAAHSIKGGAGTFGFTDMTELTHALETPLDRLRHGEMALKEEMIGVFLEAGDAIAAQLAAHRGGATAEREMAQAVQRKLARLCGASAQEAVRGGPRPAYVLSAPGDEDPGYGFFDEAPGAPALADSGGGMEDEQGYGFFLDLPPVPAAPTADPSPHETRRHAADRGIGLEGSIRVGVEKVDQLINLVGELVITQSMLVQAAHQAAADGDESMQRGLHQLERNTRDLQEAVMSIRMMPISFVFNRFPRVVHDLAVKLGKQVELQVTGEHTELDKGLVEKIADPLTHLIRNSLDHGIEPSARREAAGKPACGTVMLKAYHQGGHVVIEVADDGAGLNRARILAKARENGLPLREGMSDQEICALIMEPGFSTAETITDLSGRGVGMDVVKRNITELGGRLELDSVEGLGTRTVIRLPLTLAILDGLSVSVGRETYIIPLNAIVESLQPGAADVKTVSGQGRLLRVRDDYLPLVALHEVFNIRPLAAGPEQGIVVIVETGGRRTALLVDELLGQHLAVIKSLEANFRKIRGISGATIMGDGKVALILDVAALAAGGGSEAQPA